MGPEIRLILGCARTTVDDEARAGIERSIAEGPDWDQVTRLGSWYRVSALVGATLLDAVDSSSLPGPTVACFESAYQRNGFAHRFRRAALRDLLDACATAEIPLIVLKGAALAGRVYSDPACRTMGDLDLLVAAHDLDRAVGIARDLGYREAPEPHAGREARDSSPRHAPRLVSDDGLIHVELHRHLVDGGSPLHFDIEECWRDARSLEVAGDRLAVLSDVDAVLHACVGVVLDRRRYYRSFGALRQLCDVAELARYCGDGLDWDFLVATARRRGAHGIASCGLRTAVDLLAAPVPGEVLRDLAPGSFDAAMQHRFVARTIFETRPWFLHELVTPKDNTSINLVKSGIRRFVPDPVYLGRKYWPHGTGEAALRRHARESLAFLWRAVTRFEAVRDDLRVDRWLHELESLGLAPVD